VVNFDAVIFVVLLQLTIHRDLPNDMPETLHDVCQNQNGWKPR